MPICRTYVCPECAYVINVMLSADQWDAPPPSCPECDRREMQQEFRPVAIAGTSRSNGTKARDLADDIIANDYKVADIHHEHRREGTPKVRYQDQSTTPALNAPPSSWVASDGVLETAIAHGREVRRNFGSGLDILQGMIKTGHQPDLIEASKRRSPKIW